MGSGVSDGVGLSRKRVGLAVGTAVAGCGVKVGGTPLVA
jgi:hypothetical protein